MIIKIHQKSEPPTFLLTAERANQVLLQINEPELLVYSCVAAPTCNTPTTALQLLCCSSKMQHNNYSTAVVVLQLQDATQQLQHCSCWEREREREREREICLASLWFTWPWYRYAHHHFTEPSEESWLLLLHRVTLSSDPAYLSFSPFFTLLPSFFLSPSPPLSSLPSFTFLPYFLPSLFLSSLLLSILFSSFPFSYRLPLLFPFPTLLSPLPYPSILPFLPPWSFAVKGRLAIMIIPSETQSVI